MKLSVVVVTVSMAVGVVAALLTGLFDVTPAGLVGAIWFGYPLPWLFRLILAPQYYPWTVDWFNLALDILVWCAIAVVIGAVILGAVLPKRQRSSPAGEAAALIPAGTKS